MGPLVCQYWSWLIVKCVPFSNVDFLIVSFIFNYWIEKKWSKWWEKYTFNLVFLLPFLF